MRTREPIFTTMEVLPLYNHSFILPFEENFSLMVRLQWLRQNLFIPIILGLLYIAMIFNGPEIMKKRKPFNLQIPFTIWNFLFAFASCCGTFRLFPELVRTVRDYGLYQSVCNGHSFADDPVIGFWCWVMAYCKVLQLVDTLFIILRKKEITFLHCYHHFTDLYAAAYASLEVIAQGRWYLTMNYFVHGVMNTYFAFRTMRYKMPEYVPKIVTALQVLQMAIAVYVTWVSYAAMKQGLECHSSRNTVKLSLAWYTVSLVIFGNFYYQKYIMPKPPAEEKEKSQ